jgi:hypothetical protein
VWEIGFADVRFGKKTAVAVEDRSTLEGGEPPEMLVRVNTALDAVASIRGISTAEESLEEVLSRVADGAVAAVADIGAVTITVLEPPVGRTVAYTDERLLPLDEKQYVSRRGPCLEAADTRRIVRGAMASHEHRWPEFVAAARTEGVRATLSIPLIVASPTGRPDSELVGSLNAYSTTAAGFDRVDETLLALYTDAAGQAISHARRWQHLRNTITQLEQAMTSRAEIEQAKGALRVVHACTADEAFALLVERSQRENVKLRDLARRVLDEMTRRVPAQSAAGSATDSAGASGGDSASGS